jgi:hypothetical protein
MVFQATKERAGRHHSDPTIGWTVAIDLYQARSKKQQDDFSGLGAK